jgi:hypothetical protein
MLAIAIVAGVVVLITIAGALLWPRDDDDDF